MISKKEVRPYLLLQGPCSADGGSLACISFAFGRGMAIEALMPGLIGVSVFFTCSAISPVAFPWETAQRTLEKLISAPLAIWTILFGDMLASALVGIIVSIVPITIALGFGVTFTSPLMLALAVIVGSVCFATMALLISVPPVSAPQYTQMLSTLIKFPLLFISGVFIPLSSLSPAARAISFISPLTYFTDIARYPTGHGSNLPLYVDFLAIPALKGGVFLFFTGYFISISLPPAGYYVPINEKFSAKLFSKPT